MFRPFGLVSLVFLAASFADAQTASTQPPSETPVTTDALFTGLWMNDRGSGVNFLAQNGRLSGFYQTALGQPDKSRRFPLTGFVEGDQITFTVNFKGFGSMTSWTGQLTRDAEGDYIRTLWNLTRNIEDNKEEDDLWQSIVSGASDFRRVGP